jgi:RNA polymerase sigma-70 factor (ECF subfamily)
VIDHYRHNGRNPQELTGVLEDLEKYAGSTPEPKNEICQCIHPLLENLKPEYRDALVTIDLGDGSLSDLASRAGITQGNAAVRLHRARQAMLKQVQMTCGACAEHQCVDCDCKHDF